ncbi:MAG: PH domain-containing protein [Xanthomonadales bacterium]|nr:PH domain-containing protein [Xanthomonadales bacterium]
MASPTDGDAPLLDARLRFPVHALPHERVVWSGSADARAYRAALLRAVWAIAVFALLALLVVHNGIDADAPCRRTVETADRTSNHGDCTASERAQRAANLRALQRGAGKFGLTAIAAALLVQWIANVLRRRHLVYIVTNERVVVQDGYLGIRLDTIDLDHVVSITAKAGLVERWFGVKSVSVTVPGQKAAIWQRGVMLANAIELWGLPAQDPALSQLLNVWLPRSRG